MSQTEKVLFASYSPWPNDASGIEKPESARLPNTLADYRLHVEGGKAIYFSTTIIQVDAIAAMAKNQRSCFISWILNNNNNWHIMCNYMFMLPLFIPFFISNLFIYLFIFEYNRILLCILMLMANGSRNINHILQFTNLKTSDFLAAAPLRIFYSLFAGSLCNRY